VGNDGRNSTLVLNAAQIASRPEAATEAVIVVLHPPGPSMGKRFPLHNPEHVIGRLAEVDIPVDADSVSRRHARIVRGPEGNWFLEDLNSTNGSFANDVKVARHLLHDGDILKFGAAILKFLSGSNIEASYHEEIYKMTILDGLTGVHNKRYFLEFLEREVARAVRHMTQLGLVMFDVDFFKRVNDTYGHLAGDAVLKEICRRLRPRVRKEDLLARYGGEEFACVLPDTSPQGVITFAEQVRQIVEREPIQHEANGLWVTISLGCAFVLPGMNISPTELVAKSDEKLYEAKRGGRNRVCA
jgi:diguanylate cyclase (GGDEF)-like protein